MFGLGAGGSQEPLKEFKSSARFSKMAMEEGSRAGRGKLEVGRSCEDLALIKPDPGYRLVLPS